jgi:DNA-binding transcriptional regulator YiaG
MSRPEAVPLMDRALSGKITGARSKLLGRGRFRGRAPHIADPTATGNQGRTVVEPLTGSQRADYRDIAKQARRSGSRSPSNLDVAGVRAETSLSIFYGYPADLIARWCGVSVATAKRWKSGARKPSRQALRLFSLHRDGRVLSEHWRGWKVNDSSLVDPADNCTTAAQLSGYAIILQWVAAVAAQDPDTQRQYYELLKRA